MARPTKETVDYFPHYTNGLRKTIDILQNKYGNEGYAFWFQLLEFLCNQKGLVYDAGNPANMEYLASKTHVTVENAELMLDKLAELNAIDAFLWRKRIIWSDNLLENVKDAFKKRANVMPQKPVIEVSDTGNPANNTINPTFEGNPVEEIHERREREREKVNEREIKLNEIKEKEIGNEDSLSLNSKTLELLNYYSSLKQGESISAHIDFLRICIDEYSYDWTKEAIQLCIKNKNKFIKPWIEKVLMNWKAEGKSEISTEKAFNKKSSPPGGYSGQRQYDINELEKQLLGKSDSDEENPG